jgi:hypothetical protein
MYKISPTRNSIFSIQINGYFSCRTSFSSYYNNTISTSRTITNKETGEPVLSIPLVKYLLLTEAEGHEMTNQEYLDRQDEYNMTFFLDESMKWINTSIIINDWVVRFNELDM